MLYAHGTVQWSQLDVATTTYTVSGLPFAPKALRFFTDRSVGSATDDVRNASKRHSVGFATSATNRKCVSSLDNHASGTMSCASVWSEQAIAAPIDLTSFAGLLDISSFTSDGFVLVVDLQPGIDFNVHWEAWGGDDITVAEVIAIAEPAATGNVDYTVTGFVSGAADQVVMFAGVQATAAAHTWARGDSGLMVGFATSGDDARNVVVVGNNDDGEVSADTDGYCKTAECLAMITVAGGNPSARAKLTQFNTDGFRLNWIARGTTNRRYIALAIKGGRWQAGSYTINGNTGSATATVSGLDFSPLGVSLIGRMTAEDTAGTATAQDRLSVGSGSSPSSRKSSGLLSEDGTASADVNTTVQFDQVLAFPSTTATLQAAYDINAMNSDGFQIIVDVAGGVASEWQGYLTFGTAPGAAAIVILIGL